MIMIVGVPVTGMQGSWLAPAPRAAGSRPIFGHLHHVIPISPNRVSECETKRTAPDDVKRQARYGDTFALY